MSERKTKNISVRRAITILQGIFVPCFFNLILQSIDTRLFDMCLKYPRVSPCPYVRYTHICDNIYGYDILKSARTLTYIYGAKRRSRKLTAREHHVHTFALACVHGKFESSVGGLVDKKFILVALFFYFTCLNFDVFGSAPQNCLS